ncbi:MAG: ATP phosphoribosyltransferase regulatory subunit [Candidatus Nitrospinota bacterium M3_3B_026]
MTDVPRGVKALLYQEAAILERIEGEVLRLFESWGFQKVNTPAIEFFSELSKGLDGDALKEVITFTDPAGGGRPLALRSDVTPQIARIAATSLARRPRPIRLCYAQTVYRSVRPGAGERMELYQAGVELIGSASVEADAEMVAIGSEALRRLGLKDVRIAISHVGYIKELIDAAALDTEDRAAARQALVRKDAARLSAVLDRAGAEGPAREALEKLPSLFGGFEVLDAAPSVNKRTEESLSNLRGVLSVLEKYNLSGVSTLDLGETRGFGYYTGVTFEGFVKGVGRRVLSGGRYDNLLAAYGQPGPATGFALDVDRILDHFHRAGEPADWSAADALVIGANGGFLEAAGLAQRLREKGLRAARDIIIRPLEESLDYARKMRISSVVITGLPDAPEGSVKLVRVETGEELWLKTEELMGSI